MLVAFFRRQVRAAGAVAAALQQDNVVPDTVDVAVPLPGPDFTETAFPMQRTARRVAGHDVRLQSPIPFGLGNVDQTPQQCCSDPLAVRFRAGVDADLSDAGRASIIGNGRQRRPTEDAVLVIPGNGSADRQVTVIPRLPDWRRRHEGGQTGRQPFAVNRPDLGPIAASHLVDDKVQGACSSRQFSPIDVVSLIEIDFLFNGTTSYS